MKIILGVWLVLLSAATVHGQELELLEPSQKLLPQTQPEIPQTQPESRESPGIKVDPLLEHMQSSHFKEVLNGMDAQVRAEIEANPSVKRRLAQLLYKSSLHIRHGGKLPELVQQVLRNPWVVPWVGQFLDSVWLLQKTPGLGKVLQHLINADQPTGIRGHVYALYVLARLRKQKELSQIEARVGAYGRGHLADGIVNRDGQKRLLEIKHAFTWTQIPDTETLARWRGELNQKLDQIRATYHDAEGTFDGVDFILGGEFPGMKRQIERWALANKIPIFVRVHRVRGLQPLGEVTREQVGAPPRIKTEHHKAIKAKTADRFALFVARSEHQQERLPVKIAAELPYKHGASYSSRNKRLRWSKTSLKSPHEAKSWKNNLKSGRY